MPDTLPIEALLASSETPPARPTVLDGFLSRKQLAADVNRDMRTILRWEKQGLPVIQRGNLRLYDREQVRAWLRRELPIPEPRGRGRPPKGRAA
jgi:hypothetical protein